MRLVIVGVDHEVQHGDESFKTFIQLLVRAEQVGLIGEEFPSASTSVAHQVAQDSGIPWIQVDMNLEERVKAGIYDKLCNRMQIRGYDEHGMPVMAIRYAPVEDGVREEFWLHRVFERQGVDAALLICGAIHARKVAQKAEQKGQEVRLLFVPEVPGSQFWMSIIPELF
jgi:hypothetical protein